MQAEVYNASWLVTDAYERACGRDPRGRSLEDTPAAHPAPAAAADNDAANAAGAPAASSVAIGGASLQQFQWACSVSHRGCKPAAAPVGMLGEPLHSQVALTSVCVYA